MIIELANICHKRLYLFYVTCSQSFPVAKKNVLDQSFSFYAVLVVFALFTCEGPDDMAAIMPSDEEFEAVGDTIEGKKKFVELNHSFSDEAYNLL